MTEKTTTTTIEILGKQYPVRCLESEVESLQKAARLLDQNMQQVQESGKAINLERIAIISALNIAHQLIEIDSQKGNVLHAVNQRIAKLQQKVESALEQTLQTEFLYSSE